MCQRHFWQGGLPWQSERTLSQGLAAYAVHLHIRKTVRHGCQNALNFEVGERKPVEQTLAETLFARVKLNCDIFVCLWNLAFCKSKLSKMEYVAKSPNGVIALQWFSFDYAFEINLEPKFVWDVSIFQQSDFILLCFESRSGSTCVNSVFFQPHQCDTNVKLRRRHSAVQGSPLLAHSDFAKCCLHELRRDSAHDSSWLSIF